LIIEKSTFSAKKKGQNPGQTEKITVFLIRGKTGLPITKDEVSPPAKLSKT
jgi:hypothetical protein